MNREELLESLFDWKDTITDEEWNSWLEYKSTEQYNIDLELHVTERIVAIHFYCAERIQSVLQYYK
jgi:hypothetical protein